MVHSLGLLWSNQRLVHKMGRICFHFGELPELVVMVLDLLWLVSVVAAKLEAVSFHGNLEWVSSILVNGKSGDTSLEYKN